MFPRVKPLRKYGNKSGRRILGETRRIQTPLSTWGKAGVSKELEQRK